MNIRDIKIQTEKIKKLKSRNNFNQLTLLELQKLPTLNGVIELNFNNKTFYMLNISNDDAVALKYLWRDKYENLSLNLWFNITRKTGYFFDIGAHTGIYSIIGNLDKTKNTIISIEPFYLNFSRLLSNLKLNNISPNNCILAALSKSVGKAKLNVPTAMHYHSAGGKISESGNLNITKLKLDNFSVDKKINGIKIDTEGHEYEVLEGGSKLIEKFLPDIIFEINEKCFNKCLNFLKSYNYSYYYIDEIEKELSPVTQFSSDLKRPEGTNCYATRNTLEQKNLKNIL